MIPAEQRAEIRRLFYAEHWKVGTIAAALGVHRDTVTAAIEAERFVTSLARPRPSQLDPYLPFLRDTLQQYPRLRATRLYQMVRVRGYAGSVVQLRRVVRRLRPVPKAEAYLRLSVLPGEQAQVDWGSFGTLEVGRMRRPLSCFVMVLSWSRAIDALFTLDQTLESFLRGHLHAFGYFAGVARTLLYDNLKSAVLERRGEAIRFHPRLLELCAHYHYAARPVAVARGNEKGRVERQIAYLRSSFFAARAFRDVDDLNAQFARWREEVAHQRRVPGEPSLTVAEALERERTYLLPLPEHPLETDLMRVVHSGKTPYLRFDRNLYSIPHERVGQPLTLVASATQIRVLDGEREVARHARSYDSGACVEDPAHLEGLVRAKQQARDLTRRDRLRAAVPESVRLFEAWALRGESLAYHSHRLLKLLDDYGAEELRVATCIAIERGAPTSGSIAHVLEQRRRAQGLKPPVPIDLSHRPELRDLRLIPNRLEDYDALGQHHADPDDRDPDA